MGILKIGVVGCGRIGKLHINNLINSVPGVQVVAAADPMLDKSGAREWLAERKITNVSTDFMDVINNPEVDVVFVCSSTDTHCDVSMAAFRLASTYSARSRSTMISTRSRSCSHSLRRRALSSR